MLADMPLLGLGLLPILIGLNAFFVAAEYAIVTVRSSRVEELVAEGVRRARILGRLKEDVQRSLATMQICITATNLIIGAVSEPAFTRLLSGLLSTVFSELSVPAHILRPISVALGMAVVTFFTVVLSELLPKALSLQYTDTIALWVAGPVAVLDRICRPVSWLMNATGAWITRMLGLGRMEIEEQVHSEDELEILVDRAAEEGEFHEEHGELLRRAFDFADLNVRHVMIPMAQAAVVDSNMTADELAMWLGDRPFTRWPLRDAKSGRINGVVSIKMVMYAVASAAGEAIILHDLATPPFTLDPDLPLVDALSAMRKNKQHLCVVKDPNGPELGIITLEDILGAIAGGIPREARAPRKLPVLKLTPKRPAPAPPAMAPRTHGMNPMIPMPSVSSRSASHARQPEAPKPRGPTGGPA